jgi:hypothetical protein
LRNALPSSAPIAEGCEEFAEFTSTGPIIRAPPFSHPAP